MTMMELESNEASYFAYGTLLELEEMHKYCPSAKPLGIFRLKNFRLAFKTCGSDPSVGGCTLIEVPDNIMHGILYKMPAEERKNLDKVSGIDKGLWVSKKITLVDADGNGIGADTFIIPNPSGPHLPPASYTRPILAGARAIPLPADYIIQLESIIKNASQK